MKKFRKKKNYNWLTKKNEREQSKKVKQDLLGN
jgi:hypothetical protein